MQTGHIGRRTKLLMCMTIFLAFAYLLIHAHEPLRLSIGDPWSDANVMSSIRYARDYGFLETSFTDILDVGPLTDRSYRYIHYPPFAEITYATISRTTGIATVGGLRFFAILFSAAGVWFFFCYVAAMYNRAVASVAATLMATNFLWLMYADSIHQAPIMTASMFGALYSLTIWIQRKSRSAAAFTFSFAGVAFLTSYDCYLFLPAGVLVTIWQKVGNPFAAGARRFWFYTAIGCALGILVKFAFVIGAVGFTEFVSDLHFQFLERSTNTFERHFQSMWETIWRRETVLYSPLYWALVVFQLLVVVRARNFRDALHRYASWMTFCGFAFLKIFAQLAASQVLPSQVLLPGFCVGAATVIVNLWRTLHVGPILLTVLVTWGLTLFWKCPRVLLETRDSAAVSSYLRAHDTNDFLLSNLMTDGHVQATWDKHYWPLSDGESLLHIAHHYRSVFDRTGTTSATAVVFTDPMSRFIEKSIWPVALPLRVWSITGWPWFFQQKVKRIIGEYDRRIIQGLKSVGATLELQSGEIQIYRLERTTVDRVLANYVTPTEFIDFGSATSDRFKGHGWSGAKWDNKKGVGFSTQVGAQLCKRQENNSPSRCVTQLTKRGLMVPDAAVELESEVYFAPLANCSHQLTVHLIDDVAVDVEIDGAVSQLTSQSKELTILVPLEHVRHPTLITFRRPKTSRILSMLRGSLSVTGIRIRTTCKPATNE